MKHYRYKGDSWYPSPIMVLLHMIYNQIFIFSDWFFGKLLYIYITHTHTHTHTHLSISAHVHKLTLVHWCSLQHYSLWKQARCPTNDEMDQDTDFSRASELSLGYLHNHHPPKIVTLLTSVVMIIFVCYWMLWRNQAPFYIGFLHSTLSWWD
jgi:hypothetical protein